MDGRLAFIKNNPQIMGNKTVQNVFQLLESKNREGLIDLYKQTCQTTNNKPDERFLK